MDRELFVGYYSIYEDIIKRIGQVKYEYMENNCYYAQYIEQCMNGDISESQKIYWKELLLRTHFTVVASLIRSKKWIYGVIIGMEANNLMIFSSSLRGYLESVVDTYYSLQSIPTAFSLNYKNIKAALDGKLNQLFVSDEIESKLIHFQYALKDKKQPKNKQALTNTDYIKNFDLEEKGIKKLYSELCEVTHPASKSVNCFSKEIVVSETHSYSIIDEKCDEDYIEKILETYTEQIKQLMKIDISLNGLILKVINLFEYEEVYTKDIDESIFANLINDKRWNEILEMVEKGEEYLTEHGLEKVVLC